MTLIRASGVIKDIPELQQGQPVSSFSCVLGCSLGSGFSYSTLFSFSVLELFEIRNYRNSTLNC